MTVVEWLINEIDMQYPEINIRRKEWMTDKAKAMEKEQIDNAWDRGYKQGYYDPEFENETFKSE